MTKKITNTTTIYCEGLPVGWVHEGGCQNKNCKVAMRAGKMFHAIPKEGTLDVYHYATLDEAQQVILNKV